MTPGRYRACLEALGWSQRYLAVVLGCSDRLPRLWAMGGAPVPPAVAEWLVALVAAHEAVPVPANWRQPRGRPRSPAAEAKRREVWRKRYVREFVRFGRGREGWNRADAGVLARALVGDAEAFGYGLGLPADAVARFDAAEFERETAGA